ncbi:hypothetical protein B0H13DRAFT_1897242 [Mycena leptocephala]|nr:hypothetical protein B0H13DRAFT_1897242 [Mycena leptocephala]
MPSQPSATQVRLNNVITYVEAAVDTLEMISDSLKTPFLDAISLTTRSLLTSAQSEQAVKQNKDDCSRLMEQTHQLLYAVIALHIKSDTGGELSPIMLKHIGNFTVTLHKVHHFVEAQQQRSRIKQFFLQGEMNALLKDCNAGLQHALDSFHVGAIHILSNAAEMQEYARDRQQEVLELISSLSDANSSDGASSAPFKH